MLPCRTSATGTAWHRAGTAQSDPTERQADMPRKSRPYRGRRCALLATMTVALVFAAGPGTAFAQTGVGGQLFATGGTVELDVQPASAGFVTELFLRNDDGTRGPTLALNTEVGKHVVIGPFPAGREPLFGVFVRH